MKKIVSLLLAVVIAAGILTAAPLQPQGLSVVAGAEEATTQPETTTPETTEPEGSDENGLVYELNDSKNGYIVRGSSADGDIVIPDQYNNLPVIDITGFTNNKNITSVVLPDSIKYIDQYAFNNCTSLKTIKLPANLTEIHWYAFSDCTSLESIIIPETVTYIGDEAFKGCSKLSSISIPDSVTNIDSAAFSETAYYNDANNWENGVLYIDNHLMTAKNLTDESYRVKPGTVSITYSAFSNCDNLEVIWLPKTLKIMYNCFSSTSAPSMIFYEGTVEEFSQIELGDNEYNLRETLVVLEADGAGTPTKVTVKSVSNVADGVKVSWSSVENADAYVVWRRGAGTKDWTLLGITTETSAIDTSAGHRQFWRYSVQAMNADGLSEFDFTGKYLKYIQTPELTGISNVKNGLRFTWKGVSGATGYRVYRRAAGAKSWRYLGTVKGTSYTDTGVKNANGKFYRYTVRAVVDKRYSGYEDFLYLKRLSNPTLKSATSTGKGILVNWGSVKGSSGYLVYRKTEGSSWTRIATVKGVNNTTYTDTTAKKGVTYIYTVRAYSGKARSHYYSGIKCTR